MALSKEQILKNIERAELALSKTEREGAKNALVKQIAQMKSDLAALEKEEKKEGKKEEKVEEKKVTTTITKEQILKNIERAEQALSRTEREGAKAALNKQITQMKSDLAALEKETIKKEEKIEEKEKEAINDLDAEIANCEAILKRQPGAKIKEVFEKKLKQAKEKKAALAQEAKEDKAEAKQELKEVKDAVKDIEKAVAAGKTTEPIKKPKIEEKKREDKSKKRVIALKTAITSLQSLVDKNKELKDLYQGKKVDLERDAGRPAKPFGYRFTGNDYRVPTPAQVKAGLKRGNIDYEARPNRSDVYPKGYQGNVRQKLADGGTIGASFTIKEMKELLNEKFPDSFRFELHNQKKGERWNSLDYDYDKYNGLEDSDIKHKICFPQYKRDHSINYDIMEGEENTYFRFLLQSVDGNTGYVGTFGFKDQGMVGKEYITGFLVFLQEQYGLPFQIEHKVMAKGGMTMAKGGTIVGDKVKVEIKGGKTIIGTIEKQNPLKIRTDATSTQVIPSGLVVNIQKMADGGTTMAKGGSVDGVIKTYAKMLNELSKEKQFNKKIEKKSQLDKFAKSNEITIDNNNIIYIKGERFGFIDKINQKTGQEKANWELKKFADGGMAKRSKSKRSKYTWDPEEDKMTGEREGERRAGMDEDDYKTRKAPFSFKPYGETKGKFKITYMADGKKQSEIKDSKEMAMDTAKRYAKIEEFSNIEVFDETGNKIMASGGKVSTELDKFYEEAKKSDSVKDLKVVNRDEFKFICKSDDDCKVSIRYDQDSDTVVMSQYRKHSKYLGEDDDISLQDFKKYLSEKMAKGGQTDINVGNRKVLDQNKNGILDKEDFQILRGEKKKKMAKGGTLKPMRKNSRHRFCWSKDAVKDGIIKQSQLKDTPSKHMRRTHPAYIMEK